MNTNTLVEKYIADMVAMRREIHRHPELSNKEFDSTKRIEKFLKGCGIEILDVGMKTGCIAVLKGGHPGKTVGLREDIDALPILEQTGLPFASENEGVMHACGHDIHQTVLMYTAKCLSEIREELYGDVLFIFQPAEEALYGALDTMATKFYEKCHPDVLAGLHCSPEWDAGTIGVIKGPANASSDFLYVTVHGKAGHGAHPENFVDPIMISGYLLAELQTVVSRVNRPVYPAVLTFGSIHGGKAGNVVPEKVEMVGTLRSLDPGSRKLMHEEINRIVENGAAAFRGKGEVKWADGMPPLINDAKVIDAIEKAAAETIGKENVNQIPYPSTGSDDFSWMFPKLCPGCQFRLGTGNDTDSNTRCGLHNPKNVFDETALPTGVKVLTQFTRDYLAKP
ncbi:M20 metallopeptidase family protein [Acidaminococcus timonensis]|uniref:M20 metallopeptidase family protein n=1 Tax=Acidaminococcus timonensis TaxID=1871002 RepID=UPI00266506F2|nr:M20 family metallopeptidase [uncultured Acidaminococcus sp.]